MGKHYSKKFHCRGYEYKSNTVHVWEMKQVLFCNKNNMILIDGVINIIKIEFI